MNTFISDLIGLLQSDKRPKGLNDWIRICTVAGVRVAAIKLLSAGRGADETVRKDSRAYKPLVWLRDNPVSGSEVFIFDRERVFIDENRVNKQELSDYIKKNYSPPVRR